MNSFTSRFGILFYAETKQAESGLQKLSGMFNNMHLSLLAMQNITGRVFSAMSGAILGAVKGLINEASEVEKTKAMFMFAFRDIGDNAIDIYKQAQDAGLRSIQTTEEILQLTKDLKLMGRVNIFDPDMPELFDSTRTKLLPLVDVLDDMTSQMARDTAQGRSEAAKFGLMALLNGDFQSARRRLDPIAGIMDQYKDAMKGVIGQQERLRAIAPLLARDFGGAGATIRDTWEGVSKQMEDIFSGPTGFLNMLGTPLKDSLIVSMREFKSFFLGTPDGILLSANIHRLEALKDTFADIGEKIGFAAVFAKDIALGLFEILRTHPGIIKFVAQLGLAATILAGVLATVIALKVAFMALVFAGPLGAVIVALTAGAALIGKWAVGGEGVVDTFHKFRIVAVGVMEILSTMSGHTAELSGETVKLAGDKGVLGIIIKIGMFAFRVGRVLSGIKDGIMENIGVIQSAFMPAWTAVDAILTRMGFQATTSSNKWHDAGVNIGRVLAGIATGVGAVLSVLAKITNWLTDNESKIKVIGGILGLIIAPATTALVGSVAVGNMANDTSTKPGKMFAHVADNIEKAFFGGNERDAAANATSAQLTESQYRLRLKREAESPGGSNSVINIHNYVDGHKAALKRFEIASARGTFNMVQDIE